MKTKDFLQKIQDLHDALETEIFKAVGKKTFNGTIKFFNGEEHVLDVRNNVGWRIVLDDKDSKTLTVETLTEILSSLEEEAQSSFEYLF